jgi:hypothetical protein
MGSARGKVLRIVMLACQLQAVVDSVAWQRLPVFLVVAARCRRYGFGGCRVGVVGT